MKKVEVTLNGKKFTRRTERPYRFAIVGRMIVETEAQLAVGADHDRVARLQEAGYFDLHVLGWTQVDPSKMVAKFQKEMARRWVDGKIVDLGLVYTDVAIVPVGGAFPRPDRCGTCGCLVKVDGTCPQCAGAK